MKTKLSLILILALAIAFGTTTNVQAAEGIDVGPHNDTGVPLYGGGDEPDDDDEDDDATATTVSSTVTNFFEFFVNISSFTDALNYFITMTIEDQFVSAARSMETHVTVAYAIIGNFNVDGFDGFSGNGSNSTTTFSTFVFELWLRTRNVAFVLLPFVIVFNVVIMMINGVQGGNAKSEMIDILIRTMILVMVVSGSYAITHFALKAGWGLTSLLLSDGAPAILAAKSFSALIRVTTSGGGMAYFFILLFILILYFVMIGAMMLSYYAILTVALIVVVLSPIMIVIGEIPQFKWVYGLWLKIGGVVILLPAINAVLYSIWNQIFVYGNFVNSSSFLGSAIAIGMMSIITTINFKAGQMVFGSAIQTGKMAVGAALAVGKLALDIGMGIATGGASLTASAAGAAAGMGGGPTGPGGAGGAGAGPDGAGDPTAGAGGGGNRSPQAMQAAQNLSNAYWQPRTGVGRGMQKMSQQRQRDTAFQSRIAGQSSFRPGGAGAGASRNGNINLNADRFSQSYTGGNDISGLGSADSRKIVRGMAGDMGQSLSRYDQLQRSAVTQAGGTAQPLVSQFGGGASPEQFAGSMARTLHGDAIPMNAGFEQTRLSGMVGGSPSSMPAQVLADTFTSMTGSNTPNMSMDNVINQAVKNLQNRLSS